MPSRYFDVIRLFTNILKPPFATLPKQGYTSITFVDNLYSQEWTRDEFLENAHKMTRTDHLQKNVHFQNNEAHKSFGVCFKLCRYDC